MIIFYATDLSHNDGCYYVSEHSIVNWDQCDFQTDVQNIWRIILCAMHRCKNVLCVFAFSSRFYVFSVFTVLCTIVQSAVLRSHVVCLSVCLSFRLSVTLVD